MTYSEFVSSRIKWLPTCAEDLHHAATGLMTEAVELGEAKSVPHTLEELGDLEFYFEHFQLAMAKWGLDPSISVNVVEFSLRDSPFVDLVVACGALLGLTKKAWIYEADPRALPFPAALAKIALALSDIYAFTGHTSKGAKEGNQEKLEKRYPLGYSNEAAQERADKAGMEDGL